jgi:hypothetical protein
LANRATPRRCSPKTGSFVEAHYVPIDHPKSNAGMIEKTLFARGIAPARITDRAGDERAGLLERFFSNLSAFWNVFQSRRRYFARKPPRKG